MKKRILMITAAAMGMMLSLNTAYAAGVKYKYAASGAYSAVDNVDFDLRFTAIACPGAIVEADYNMFSRCSVCAMTGGYDTYSYYACYEGDNGPETLTLGCKRVIYNNWDYYDDDLKYIQQAVADQIAYIKQIGGVMTGYSFDKDRYGNVVNISWNVGNMHHYARFELDYCNKQTLGYYDLMYTDSSDVDIAAMNDSFCVLTEWQAD